MIKVTVPEKGIGEGLAMGAPVFLSGLVARPWESEFGGQLDGIAYWGGRRHGRHPRCGSG
ncbi:hypothetical protein SALBM217S_03979 [Streptomyces griseoloalbus]